MCAQVHHAARIRDGHLEAARSGDADDSEGAEADSALPRRRCLHDRGLLGLGLGLGLSLGLLDLDLERTELVVTSKDAMVLQERGGGLTRMSTRRRSAVGTGVRLRARCIEARKMNRGVRARQTARPSPVARDTRAGSQCWQGKG
eukprot:scaffold26122_cov52-Phaeocystis_antarctica.AAC.1